MSPMEDDFCPGCEVESVLCGASRAGFDPAPLLARIQEPTNVSILADLKERYPRRLSAFWEDSPAGLHALAAIIGHAADPA